MKNHILKGYLFAIISAVIYGCMPLMAKHIYADGVNPQSLVFWRNFLSVIPLGILAYGEKKTLKIPVKLLPSISLISILGLCITPILLFSSYNYMASGTATVLHFVYPALVVIFEMLFFKGKKQWGNIVSVLLCALGIACFYSPGDPLDPTGSTLALLSGLTFASYVVLLSHFDKSQVSGFLFCFYVAVISCTSALIFCLVTNSFTFPASITGWGLCLLFSLLVTTGAVALFQRSAFLIGSERTSILSTLEPITGVILGAIFFHEPLGSRVIIGSLLVITASTLIAVFDLLKKKK